MQLTFLGKTYAASSTAVDAIELNTPGKYRGNQVSFKITQSRHFEARANMKYRGIAYS